MITPNVFLKDQQFQNDKYLNLKRFFFPLYPLKIFKLNRIIIFFALMISLKLVLTIISIKIPIFNLSISISWVPVMILGWHFGMIYGLLIGVITDTITFFAFPSGALWFWMYAIQEPCIGFLAGLIGSWCKYKQKNISKNYLIEDIIIFQIILVAFVTFSYCALLIMPWYDSKYKDVKDVMVLHDLYKYIALAMLIIFFIVCELFFCFWFIKEKSRIMEHNFIFIYATLLVIISMTIFSFALGPFSTIEYLKYKNGKIPGNYIKYGVIFYLMPRLIVQSIKVPIESLVLVAGIIFSQKYIQQTIMYTNYQWKYNNK